MDGFISFLTIVAILLGAAYMNGRRKLKEQGQWMGLAGSRAAYCWDRTPPQVREITLESIGIPAGLPQSALINKSWTGLPLPVQVALTKLTDEIAAEK